MNSGTSNDSIRTVARLLLFALIVTLLAACGSEDDDPATSGTGAGTGSTGSDGAATATTTSPATPGTTATETGTASGSATPEPAAASSPTMSASPAASPLAGSFTYPTGRDELVLQIDVRGGFAPQQFLLTELPVLSIYGDGSVIYQGPQIAIYPGPALPNLQVTTLTDEGIQAILAEAEAAGLLAGDAQYTSSMVADAPTTYFIVNANGSTTNVSAYALDFEQLPPDAKEDEREARARLREFTLKAADFRSWIPESTIIDDEVPYEVTRLQVVTQPIDQAFPGGDNSVEPTEKEWPLTTSIATFGTEYSLPESRCGVVEGADLAPMLSALETANQITQWNSGGQLYLAYVRPLLPHEDGCATSR